MVSPLATRAVNEESKKPANRGLFCASAVPVYRWRSRRLYYLQQAQRANLPTQGDDFYVFVKNFHKTTCKKSAMSLDFSNSDAGWSSLAARRAHNPKVVGSNPTPATNSNDAESLKPLSASGIWRFRPHATAATQPLRRQAIRSAC